VPETVSNATKPVDGLDFSEALCHKIGSFVPGNSAKDTCTMASRQHLQRVNRHGEF
jgi:hypothetical protein